MTLTIFIAICMVLGWMFLLLPLEPRVKLLASGIVGGAAAAAEWLYGSPAVVLVAAAVAAVVYLSARLWRSYR